MRYTGEPTHYNIYFPGKLTPISTKINKQQPKPKQNNNNNNNKKRKTKQKTKKKQKQKQKKTKTKNKSKKPPKNMKLPNGVIEEWS